MISLKLYRSGNDVIIGACDQQLIGKKFRDGKLQIDVSKRFYEGSLITIDELKKFLEEATIANLVGKQTVNCAIELGLIDPECVLTIKGVPHAQMIRMF